MDWHRRCDWHMSPANRSVQLQEVNAVSAATWEKETTDTFLSAEHFQHTFSL